MVQEISEEIVMRRQTVIKLIVSIILGIIIDLIINQFSITNIIREKLEPLMVGPFLQPIKPLIILPFFLIEITAVYKFLDKLKVFEKLIK